MQSTWNSVSINSFFLQFSKCYRTVAISTETNNTEIIESASLPRRHTKKIVSVEFHCRNPCSRWPIFIQYVYYCVSGWFLIKFRMLLHVAYIWKAAAWVVAKAFWDNNYRCVEGFSPADYQIIICWLVSYRLKISLTFFLTFGGSFKWCIAHRKPISIEVGTFVGTINAIGLSWTLVAEVSNYLLSQKREATAKLTNQTKHHLYRRWERYLQSDQFVISIVQLKCMQLPCDWPYLWNTRFHFPTNKINHLIEILEQSHCAHAHGHRRMHAKRQRTKITIKTKTETTLSWQTHSEVWCICDQLW